MNNSLNAIMTDSSHTDFLEVSKGFWLNLLLYFKILFLNYLM